MVELAATRIDGGREALSDSAISAFTNNFAGAVLTSEKSESSYDDARSLWNGMIDHKPALIAQCVNTQDVVKAVNFGRENHLLVSVRGGDHSAAGNAMSVGGLAIDLSPMSNVSVDPETKTAMNRSRALSLPLQAPYHPADSGRKRLRSNRADEPVS